MYASVIISTYNQPEWLRKVLIGYTHQSHADFELIVADDGSDDRTETVIAEFESKLPIRHVWHPDDGFRKNVILNRAAAVAEGGYLIFTDGDCIPRRDFVETHVTNAKPGHFLSGGAFRLTMPVSKVIREEDIVSGRCFDARWLEEAGQPISRHYLKLTSDARFASMLDRLTITRATWNGNNSSCWRSDHVMVDGFDERMGYGGEDREFGERLMNAGITGLMVRYSAVLIHLDHSRPYVKPGMKQDNRKIRRQTRRRGQIRTPSGLSAGAHAHGQEDRGR